MPCVRPIPFLLSLIVVVLLGLVTFGLFRARTQTTLNTLVGARDDLLLGLLVLAAFASGVFATLVLVAFQTR